MCSEGKPVSHLVEENTVYKYWVVLWWLNYSRQLQGPPKFYNNRNIAATEKCSLDTGTSRRMILNDCHTVNSATGKARLPIADRLKDGITYKSISTDNNDE